MSNQQHHDWHNRASFAWVVLAGVLGAWVWTLGVSITVTERLTTVEIEQKTAAKYAGEQRKEDIARAEKQRTEDVARWQRFENKLDDILKK